MLEASGVHGDVRVCVCVCVCVCAEMLAACDEMAEQVFDSEFL